MSGPGGGEGRGVLLLHEQVRRRGAVARGAFGSTDECRWMACLKVETGTTLGRQDEKGRQDRILRCPRRPRQEQGRASVTRVLKAGTAVLRCAGAPLVF